jgi:hypothetical protein
MMVSVGDKSYVARRGEEHEAIQIYRRIRIAYRAARIRKLSNPGLVIIRPDHVHHVHHVHHI